MRAEICLSTDAAAYVTCSLPIAQDWWEQLVSPNPHLQEDRDFLWLLNSLSWGFPNMGWQTQLTPSCSGGTLGIHCHLPPLTTPTRPRFQKQEKRLMCLTARWRCYVFNRWVQGAWPSWSVMAYAGYSLQDTLRKAQVGKKQGFFFFFFLRKCLVIFYDWIKRLWLYQLNFQVIL